jgi:hypothetical protein
VIMEALGLYLQQMDEIRRRGEIVQAILTGTSMTHYRATDLEFLTLQIRIILEKIALGSLILNKEQYSRMYDKFAVSGVR